MHSLQSHRGAFSEDSRHPCFAPFFWWQGISPPLWFLCCRAGDELESLCSCAGCADDHLLIVPQGSQPGLNVGGGVAEASGGLNTAMVQKGGGADLGNQFFPAVFFIAEECPAGNAIQAAAVAGAVGQLVECGAVILGHVLELLPEGKHNHVHRRSIIGLVSLPVLLWWVALQLPRAGTNPAQRGASV